MKSVLIIAFLAATIASEALAQCPGGVCPMPQRSTASRQQSAPQQSASRRPARRFSFRIFRGR